MHMKATFFEKPHIVTVSETKVPELEKYDLLMDTVNKIFIRRSELDKPTDRVVFFLGRLCVEDFNEIFVFCQGGIMNVDQVTAASPF